jgi:hypothetical protein
MTLNEFCLRISYIENLSNAQRAVAILWFLDQKENGVRKSSSELTKIIKENSIGNPNSTTLAKQIKGTNCVFSSQKTFHLRQDKKAEVRSWIETVLNGITTEVPNESQFLNEQVWKPTRGYIEKVCIQLNGAYHQGFYDCTAVMVRRIVETLIIEAYESQNREAEIKGHDDNYLMLGGLVGLANATGGLSLGREAKKGLEEIKKLGDRSAHNRRYNAKKSDLDKIQDSLRITFEELANIAGLYPP